MTMDRWSSAGDLLKQQSNQRVGTYRILVLTSHLSELLHEGLNGIYQAGKSKYSNAVEAMCTEDSREKQQLLLDGTETNICD